MQSFRKSFLIAIISISAILIFKISELSAQNLSTQNTFLNNEILNYPEIKTSLPSFNLLGKHHLKVFGLNIYYIALFSDVQNFSYNNKLAILINYQRDFSKNKLIDKSIEEIARINNLSDDSILKNYRQKLQEIFYDVKKGDRKLAFFDPKKGLKLYFNGTFAGEISDLTLARRFIDIWLSNKSSYPQMTADILGKGGN